MRNFIDKHLFYKDGFSRFCRFVLGWAMILDGLAHVFTLGGARNVGLALDWSGYAMKRRIAYCQRTGADMNAHLKRKA